MGLQCLLCAYFPELWVAKGLHLAPPGYYFTPPSRPAIHLLQRAADNFGYLFVKFHELSLDSVLFNNDAPMRKYSEANPI